MTPKEIETLRNFGKWLDMEFDHTNTRGLVVKAAQFIETQQADLTLANLTAQALHKEVDRLKEYEWKYKELCK